MDRIYENNLFVNKSAYPENSFSPENSGDSPRMAVSNETKIAASTFLSKKSKRSAKKKVMTVPMKEVEGLIRVKGDNQMISSPPLDSWTWRKYGQKPIKGSPYPRAYYRCSSSKGCPAKKQVERSKTDPKLVLITYSYEHNHPFPLSRSHQQTTTSIADTTTENITTSLSDNIEEEKEEEKNVNIISTSKSHDQLDSLEYKKFQNLGEDSLSTNVNDQFGWFNDFNSTLLESPMLLTDDHRIVNDEIATIFSTMREEDEPLFADLGELPECSMVFRRGMRGGEAAQQQLSLATTG